MLSVNGMKLKVGGVFHLLLRKANGEVKRELQFKNLITNYGMEKLITGNLGIDYLLIGNGTSEPSFGDTKLAGTSWWWTSDNYVSSAIRYNRTIAPFWSEKSVKMTFRPGLATGTLTEIGLTGDYATNKPTVRTLIKDSNGNPTSIVKEPDDFLDVSYTFRSYAPSEDASFSLNINGVNHAGIIRPFGLFDTSYLKWQPLTQLHIYEPYSSTANLPVINSGVSATRTALTGAPAVTSVPSSHVVSRVPSEFKRRFTSTWNPDKGNMTIRSVIYGTGSSEYGPMFGIQFDPPIVKTASQRLVLSCDLEIIRS